MSESTPPFRTLDRRIRDDLESRIRSGDWKPGDRIPTEQELMAQYGCARMTVGKAVSGLVDAGLVERRKKAGSFVARPHVQTAVLEIPDLPALIEKRGQTYRFERLSWRLRSLILDDPGEAALGSDGEILAVSGVHHANDVPFALEHRVINLAAVPDAKGNAFEQEPPGSWLLHHVPWTEAHHKISAVNLDAKQARLLATPRATACLRVERHTYRSGDWITFVRLTFPGDRYDLTASFRP